MTTDSNVDNKKVSKNPVKHLKTWNTKPYRQWMFGYAKDWGLEIPPGFSARIRRPLGKPARNLLLRIQKNLHARGLLAEVYVDGTFNSGTRKIARPKKTMGQRAIVFALREIGVHEDPWGSNDGKRVNYYQASTHEYNVAWCASFVWKMYQLAGYKGPTSAGAWRSTDDIGHHVADITHAVPGDIVSLNIGAGHVGILLHYHAEEGKVTLVAGNTADSVKQKEYPVTLIHSICRPV